MSHNYDVILNGCGPVGGIASLLLANRGFKVAVIDLNKSPYPHPCLLYTSDAADES